MQKGSLVSPERLRFDFSHSKPIENQEIAKINKIVNDILNNSMRDENKINMISKSFTAPLKEARESFEKEYLISQIKKFGGNISKTAKFVGMERSALHRKLKLLGVKDLN